MTMLRALALSVICFLCLFSVKWDGVAALDSFQSCEGQPATIPEYAEYMRTVVNTAALPFWHATVDETRGGFLIVPGARRIIEQARLVWSLSNAESHGFSSTGYDNTAAAKKGVDFLLEHFLDEEYGGFYWSTDDDGVVTDDRKYLQGQLTVLAALSKYYAISGENRAREAAFALLETIVRRAKDTTDGGWYEHFTREWDVLTEGDGPIGTQGRKTIGAAIIFTQSLTDLFNATGEESVGVLLREIIQVEVPKFITDDPENANLELTLDETVVKKAGNEAGALVETVWLKLDAQLALGEEPEWDLYDTYMAFADENSDPNTGGLITDGGLAWWGQAEYVSSFSFAISKRGPLQTTTSLTRVVDLILCKFMDLADGIWFGEVDTQGNVTDDRKMYEWKVGFHETRAMTALAAA